MLPLPTARDLEGDHTDEQKHQRQHVSVASEWDLPQLLLPTIKYCKVSKKWHYFTFKKYIISAALQKKGLLCLCFLTHQNLFSNPFSMKRHCLLKLKCFDGVSLNYQDLKVFKTKWKAFLGEGFCVLNFLINSRSRVYSKNQLYKDKS